MLYVFWWKIDCLLKSEKQVSESSSQDYQSIVPFVSLGCSDRRNLVTKCARLEVHACMTVCTTFSCHCTSSWSASLLMFHSSSLVHICNHSKMWTLHRWTHPITYPWPLTLHFLYTVHTEKKLTVFLGPPGSRGSSQVPHSYWKREEDIWASYRRLKFTINKQ